MPTLLVPYRICARSGNATEQGSQPFAPHATIARAVLYRVGVALLRLPISIAFCPTVLDLSLPQEIAA